MNEQVLRRVLDNASVPLSYVGSTFPGWLCMGMGDSREGTIVRMPPSDPWPFVTDLQDEG